MVPGGLFGACGASRDRFVFKGSSLVWLYRDNRKGTHYACTNGYTKSKQHLRCWEADTHADFDIDQMGQ